jgi:hypothetical protein
LPDTKEKATGAATPVTLYNRRSHRGRLVLAGMTAILLFRVGGHFLFEEAVNRAIINVPNVSINDRLSYTDMIPPPSLWESSKLFKQPVLVGSKYCIWKILYHVLCHY